MTEECLAFNVYVRRRRFRGLNRESANCRSTCFRISRMHYAWTGRNSAGSS